ncbi:uncharacterized protein [Euphorbia lathyris]|uniref:uncharacterized protein isoform X1 n=1 Tax=Euphorbia lathyris TaxID=212925 RepID=UPI003313C3D2
MDFTRQNSHPITLLSGPPSCGKTSLLFQFAFNSTISDLNHSSAGNDPTVVFICNRRRLESKPPFLSQGIDSSSDSFQRIQMKYVDDDDGIKKYFSAFHLFDKFPVAVVIDDFGDFFNDRSCHERYGNPRGRDIAMVRILSLCHNAVMHANEKSPCKLLISDTHYGDSPRLLFIYKRWVSSIFTIKGDGKGSFLLSRNNNSGSEYSEKTRTAKYSIALQYLVFEGIIEDDKN